MLAKLTSKNQLTLPKSVTDSLGPVQYFEVQVQSGQVVLTPVRIQRGDAVRAKLAELDLGDEVFAQALAWATEGPASGSATPPKAARKSSARPAATARKTAGTAETQRKAKTSTRAAVVPAVKVVRTVKAASPAGKPVKVAGSKKAAKSAASSDTGTVRRRRSA